MLKRELYFEFLLWRENFPKAAVPRNTKQWKNRVAIYQIKLGNEQSNTSN